jgi:hypothetical protein
MISSRSLSKKNTRGFNNTLVERFSNTIDSLTLLELPLLDRLFTRSNKRASPTITRLDRPYSIRLHSNLW